MSATLDSLLEPLPWLTDPTVEDVCIQEPGVAWVFSGGKFSRHETTLDADDIEDIAIVAGAQRRRDFSHESPILGVDLVHREGRLHAVGSPHVEGCPHLAIRLGSTIWPTLEELVDQGLFNSVRRENEKRRNAVDEKLSELYRAGDWAGLLYLAAANRRTIVIAGVNGSGKTRLSKALIGKIPLHRRLIVIENARELRAIPHPNKVCFYYDKDATTGVRPTDLVDAAMRMRTEQIFLQEIRDGWETLAFMMAGQTGHRGAITTIHAGSCKEVVERMKASIKMTDAGRGWDNEDVIYSLRNLVDVIVHFTFDDDRRYVDEIIYNEPLQ